MLSTQGDQQEQDETVQSDEKDDDDDEAAANRWASKLAGGSVAATTASTTIDRHQQRQHQQEGNEDDVWLPRSPRPRARPYVNPLEQKFAQARRDASSTTEENEEAAASDRNTTAATSRRRSTNNNPLEQKFAVFGGRNDNPTMEHDTRDSNHNSEEMHGRVAKRNFRRESEPEPGAVSVPGIHTAIGATTGNILDDEEAEEEETSMGHSSEPEPYFESGLPIAAEVVDPPLNDRFVDEETTTRVKNAPVAAHLVDDSFVKSRGCRILATVVLLIAATISIGTPLFLNRKNDDGPSSERLVIVTLVPTQSQVPTGLPTEYRHHRSLPPQHRLGPTPPVQPHPSTSLSFVRRKNCAKMWTITLQQCRPKNPMPPSFMGIPWVLGKYTKSRTFRISFRRNVWVRLSPIILTKT